MRVVTGMRRLLLLFLVVPFAAPATAEAAGRCAPERGERVIERGARTVVLSRRATQSKRVIAACTRATGRRTRLGAVWRDPDYSLDRAQALVRRRYAAVVILRADRYGSQHVRVRVVVPRTRKVIAEGTTSTRFGEPVRVHSALGPRGHLAVAHPAQGASDGWTMTLWSGRTEEVLAPPGSAPVDDVAIGTRRVRWTQGGEPRQRPLGPVAPLE